MVELTLGKDTHCLILKECLHTPGALLNLLLVGHMLNHSWGCEFKGGAAGSPLCILSYCGEVLGTVPLMDILCYLPVHFLYLNDLTARPPPYKELCMYTSPEVSTLVRLYVM